MHKDPWSRKQSLYAASVPKAAAKPKIKWKILPILWLAFKRVSTVIGAIVLISCVSTVWMLSSITPETAQELPDEMVLYLGFDGNLSDVPKEASLMDPFSHTGMTVKDFTDALDTAKTDLRVRGVVANLKQGGYALANLEEMRRAIKGFRESGKFAYIYSSSYGEAGNLGTYYLATAFDEIWMQPMGMVGIMGVNAEMPFVRDVLDKIGVEPQFMQRKEYKTAYESFTNSNISEPNREMTQDLVSDIVSVLTDDIAKDRGITPTEFKALVEKGLFIDKEAKDSKLVDVLGYGDELVKKINEEVTGDPDDEDLAYIDIADYSNDIKPQASFTDDLLKEVEGAASDKKSAKEGKPALALVYASGMILSSNEGQQDGVAAADEIAEALADAAEDDDIKAVVLRIDSPGGSPVASETILHAVEQVQKKDKKVIVSMGQTAASGGYWIAAYADRIFVLPTTITGSIGVLGGKFSVQELWKAIGVNWDTIKWGQNAGMWSMNTPFSESEAERMNVMLDNVYTNFVQRVSKGRKMSVDEVEKIARGHVWSGKRAIDIGIADEFGGLDEALDFAAREIGLKSRKDADIIIMPKPLTALEKVIKLLEMQAAAGEAIGVQAEVFKAVSPILKEAIIATQPQNHMVYNPLTIK